MTNGSDAAWTVEQHAALLEEIPSGIAVLDPSLTIVDQNRAFTELFGDGFGKHCYEVCKGLKEPCDPCAVRSVFADGKSRAVEQSGADRNGHRIHYLAQLAPIHRDEEPTAYVATIITDLTETRRLQREYQTLFEKVPCYVVVLNRRQRVVKANERFRQVFGEPTGRRCYEMFKGRAEPCADCPMEKTFADGRPHSSRHEGITRDGSPTYYAVVTEPLYRADGSIGHVVEMALDLTETHELEQELSRAELLRTILVQNALEATVILDTEGRVLLMNRAAEGLWGYGRDSVVGRRPPEGMIPTGIQPVLSGVQERMLSPDSVTVGATGERVPVRVAAAALVAQGRREGTAVIVQDLREIRQLERDKLDAERLAAVGQTVAGLAHGIKNILSGIEGGMYVTSSGLKRGNQQRVEQGWAMLQRNIGRISDLAKSLLAFARGDTPKPRLIQPADVVGEAVALFAERAERNGIRLETEISEVAPAFMDPEALHSALVNLISNAIDACLVSANRQCRVKVRLQEVEDTIVIETVDTGCGMDYEVKKKAFTSFFTTKGTGGTGLGLLVTRKIVQQHGGTITLTSSEDSGTTFRMSFPRKRLPRPPEEDANG